MKLFLHPKNFPKVKNRSKNYTYVRTYEGSYCVVSVRLFRDDLLWAAAVSHEGEMEDLSEILLFLHLVYSPGYHDDITFLPFLQVKSAEGKG